MSKIQKDFHKTSVGFAVTAWAVLGVCGDGGGVQQHAGMADGGSDISALPVKRHIQESYDVKIVVLHQIRKSIQQITSC